MKTKIKSDYSGKFSTGILFRLPTAQEYHKVCFLESVLCTVVVLHEHRPVDNWFKLGRKFRHPYINWHRPTSTAVINASCTALSGKFVRILSAL
jgi:hypothetical protein